MIPSARFGDIIIGTTGDDSIFCDLYSLYEGGIMDVASNKEFCLFILTELYNKVSLYDRQVMSWNGDTSRQQAEELFHNLDETSHLFYKEVTALLKGTTITIGSEEVRTLPDEDKFRMIAEKVIKDFTISEMQTMDDTFKEYTVLEFRVSNTKLIGHIASGLLVEC